MVKSLARKETNKRKTLFRDEAMEAAAALPSDDITFEQAWIIHKLDCLGCLLHDIHNPNARQMFERMGFLPSLYDAFYMVKVIQNSEFNSHLHYQKKINGFRKCNIGFVRIRSTNCRDNPYCIKRLGLEKFERLIKAEKLNTAKVEESQKRRDILEVPCGLTNSGNFCYVNSFLQVWYNDPIFRQIIFDWRPSSDYVRPPPPAMDVEAVMNSLQHLFYTMQTTPFEDTDENRHFTAALRLGNEQQDAQEFSLVLFDALDRNLAKHPHGEEIRRRIRERYLGFSTQRIWCTCGKESSRSLPFTALQLNIDGYKTLNEVLDAYFGEELLEDYLCDECNRRGFVKRQTVPEKLPPVVMLQLNRYVFDANGRNRKLKTPIVYPRELSARSFHLNVSKYDDFDYELFAVMIHEGDNTYCGHYYDLVRHPFTGVWYKYNDEHVEPLARPPGVERSKSAPTGRPTPDMRACYGLAYRRKELKMPDIVMPPEEITETWTVVTENKFDGQKRETMARSEKRLSDLTLRYTQLSGLFEALETHADKYKTPRDIAFLPTKLLSDILEKEYTSITPLGDNNENKQADVSHEELLGELSQSSAKRPLRVSRSKTIRHKVAQQLSSQEIPICHHGRVFVDSVLFGDVKAVSRSTAESLLFQYSIVTKVKYENDSSEDIHPLLTGGWIYYPTCRCDICVDCVKELRREGQFRDSLESHIKLATRILKDKTRCSLSRTPKPEGYLYISKKCLANFKKLALREMEHQHRLQSTGAVLQFVVDFAELDGKHYTSSSSPRRTRVIRRKRLLPRNESDIVAACNGCHTPSKVVKDDSVLPSLSENSIYETEEVKDDTVENNFMAEMTSFETNDEEKIEGKDEIMPGAASAKAGRFTLVDELGSAAPFGADDLMPSSSNSIDSCSQQVESYRYDSEQSEISSDVFQNDSLSQGNEKVASENGGRRSDESLTFQKPCEENEELSTTNSPYHPSSSSPIDNLLSSPMERPSSSASQSSTHDLGAVEFNSELRCEHGMDYSSEVE
ncbi:ubiquitinyl hydrolase 1 [Dictyocaulus viviparus]|uniref:ubiquitinyl hydrolase 1 n=1 Tax=Dictyocaulus viviparus TaxID=29172 RepID=A0A0D8XK26_DICVI|nr:ubiquitinyl hydrolase 1 [Dictyocaulus viviparus]